MLVYCEGDLIKGAGHKSAIDVLVERTTSLVLLAKIPDAIAESAFVAFTFKLNQITAPMRQTLTYEQRGEMAIHRDLARATNMRVTLVNLGGVDIMLHPPPSLLIKSNVFSF